MKILLDVGISPRLRSALSEALDGAVVESAILRNWRTLRNGELLQQAQQHEFTTLVTADKRLAQEQAPLPIAVVAVDDNRLSVLRAVVSRIASAIRETPGVPPDRCDFSRRAWIMTDRLASSDITE